MTASLQSAWDALARGDLTGATTLCLSAMTEDPGNGEIGQLLTIINSCRSITVGISSVEGLSRLGLTLSSYGHLSRAVAVFSVASILAPHDPMPRNNLAVTLFQAGLLEGAHEAFEQAIAQFPTYAAFHLGMGQTLIKLRKWDRAIESLQAALAIDPELIDAHQSLWLLGEAHNRRDLALAHQAKALERQQFSAARGDAAVASGARRPAG